MTVVDAPTFESLGQRDKTLARVRDQRCSGLLMGIERTHIEVQKLHTGGRESRAGGSREIAVAGADADDQIRFSGQRVCRSGPRCTDGTHRLRMIVIEGPLARLRFGDRNACSFGEAAQRIVGAGVDNASPGHDERLVRGTNGRDGPGQRRRFGDRPGNVPYPTGEQLFGPVPGLGLNILGKAQRHGTGLDRISQDTHGRE